MTAVLPVLLCLCLWGESPSTPQADSPAEKWFTNTSLVDQHGVEHRFYNDLIKGRTVIINTFFSECRGVCPVTMGRLTKIRDWLGDRLGRDVFMLSISVDPVKDGPKQLAGYANEIKTGSGWFLLSGTPENVKQVLTKIGQYTDVRESHSNIFIIGNDATGLWKKAQGLAPAEQLIPLVASVVGDRGAPAPKNP